MRDLRNEQNKIIQDAERVLEESRIFLSRFQSNEKRRKIRKLYSNRRAMKKMILKHENRLASSLEDLNNFAPTNTELDRIKLDLEWFLTWRLKLAHFAETMWCDGVQDLQLYRKDNRTYLMQGRIWIGPESDVNNTYLCDLIGPVVLSSNRRRIKGYVLEINYKGTAVWLRKS